MIDFPLQYPGLWGAGKRIFKAGVGEDGGSAPAQPSGEGPVLGRPLAWQCQLRLQKAGAAQRALRREESGLLLALSGFSVNYWRTSWRRPG